MSATFVTATAWLAVLAITVSAVVFGQGARFPNRKPRHTREARNRRIGTALSISGPIAVVLVSVAVAAVTGAWLPLAVVAFAAVGVVSLTGLVLAPH